MQKTIEYTVTLRQKVDEVGIPETARLIGVNHGAVWQMLKIGRDIYVRPCKEGSLWEWAEFKNFKHGKPSSKVLALTTPNQNNSQAT